MAASSGCEIGAACANYALADVHTYHVCLGQNEPEAEGDMAEFDEGVSRSMDEALRDVTRHDLSALSVGDLEERIALLREEIGRCEGQLEQRRGARNEADQLFNL